MEPQPTWLEVLDPAQNHTFRDHYLDLDLDLSDVVFLATANEALTAFFAVEMLLKIRGMGINGYMNDAFNTFDGFIVIISLVELMFAGEGSGFAALRSFRLLRIFKLARSWRSLNELLANIGKTLKLIFPFLLVLLIIMLIFALCGMQLFGGKLRPDDEGFPPRANYDSFLWSFVTTFQVMTGENWNEVMYEAVRGTTSEEYATLWDWYATFCAFAGVDAAASGTASSTTRCGSLLQLHALTTPPSTSGSPFAASPSFSSASHGHAAMRCPT